MAEESDDETYCLCRRAYTDGDFMIQCDICKDWFHGSCVGVEEHQAGDIDTYHCPNCQPEHGPLTLKRRRNWHRHDYSEINDGKKAVQSGTVVFVDNLKRNKKLCDDEVMVYLHGSQLTAQYFEKHGFSQPIMIKEKDGLGVKVPSPDFRVCDVEKYVGPLREVDVIDVNRQDDLLMKMREWTEYYESTGSRKKILNVISLEFSNTELSELVSPPTVVTQIDWINRHWPDNLPEHSPHSRPQVQKYCLMSVKDSYTDFHVDFGGTSVWYHILRGEKIFYFIPPTEENLLRYEQWVMSSNQSEIFFGNKVPKCYKCNISAGNTLLIPTGWIHAVLTPQDSLVFGGNFIHRYNIGLQLRVYEMELRLETPLKFQHPCYEVLTWFAAQNLLKEIKEMRSNGEVPANYLLEGLKEMAFVLGSWTRTKEILQKHQSQIPLDLNHGQLIEQLSGTVSKLEVLAQQETDRSKELPGGFGSPQKSPRKSPGSRLRSDLQKTALTMKLATSSSHVLTTKEDDQKISMKLSVPQTKIVSSSSKQHPYPGSEDSTTDTGGRERGEKAGREEVVVASGHRRRESGGEGGRGREGGQTESWEIEEEDEEEMYEEGGATYVDEEGEEDSGMMGDGGSTRGQKRRSDEDDDLWRPQGQVKLVKGSVASTSRKKRNVRKHSFDRSLSASSAKMARLDDDKKPTPTPPPQLGGRAGLVGGARATDPVLGGGSLAVRPETTPFIPTPSSSSSSSTDSPVSHNSQRARATAAASAVNAALAASKPKSKPLTVKQRLGKIMGLSKTGRWK